MEHALVAPKWRTLTIEKTLKLLGVDPGNGLTESEVTTRRAESGWNKIPDPPHRSWLSIWLRQFKGPLIAILFFAGIILVLLEHTSDAAVIFIVIAINSLIGFFHEARAQKAVLALRKLTPLSAVVRRAGKIKTLAAAEIVPGDIIIISEGDRIVADARLIETSYLRLNESMLTGESLPVPKDATAKLASHDPLDAPTMVFAGTAVAHGNGLAVVVATGAQTRLGAISAGLQESHTPIPLEKDMTMLARLVLIIIGVLLIIIFILGLRSGLPTTEILFIAVALAVSAIPEGLPAVLTIILSTGMWRMARRNALVKKIFAVEALGQVQFLMLDKTGTITYNQMMVTEIRAPFGQLKITGEGYTPHGSFFINEKMVERNELDRFVRIAALASPLATAHILQHTSGEPIVSGDPTEAAIKIMAEKFGINKPTEVHQHFPFDNVKKFSAAEIALDENHGQQVIAGAPEIILAACTEVQWGDTTKPMSPHEHGALAAELEIMAEHGLRIVALASKRVRLGSALDQPSEFVFEAFLGIADAVRPEAAATIARVKGAGLKVVMITGDFPVTARAVAREVGIFERGDHVITGADLRSLSETELRALLPRTTVFARVTPEDKLHIVELYQKAGHTLAMTGDGVNDAPSLVAASLGIAMGNSGTDVARQAADIILLNDNLGSIVAAIDEGRAMYQTLRKVLVYLFATNFGEICVIATAIVMRVPLPLVAVQLIWLNLITDGFFDVSLAMEPREEGAAIPKPRRAKYLLQIPDGISIALTGLLMTIGTLYMFLHYDNLPIDERRTIALVVLAIFQWFHAWMIRSERRSFFTTSLFRNPFLIAATAIVVVLQIAAVYWPPFQKILHTVPVAPLIWLQALVIASSALWIDEIRKIFRRHGAKI